MTEVTVWILVTVLAHLGINLVEDFPTKQQCEYAKLSHPERDMSECIPVNVKVRQ